jgi:hypothetical protein
MAGHGQAVRTKLVERDEKNVHAVVLADFRGVRAEALRPPSVAGHLGF